MLFMILGFKGLEYFGLGRLQLAIRGLVRVPDWHRRHRGREHRSAMRRIFTQTQPPRLPGSGRQRPRYFQSVLCQYWAPWPQVLQKDLGPDQPKSLPALSQAAIFGCQFMFSCHWHIPARPVPGVSRPRPPGHILVWYGDLKWGQILVWGMQKTSGKVFPLVTDFRYCTT